MRTMLLCLFLLAFALGTAVPAALAHEEAPPGPDVATAWTEPAVIYPESWPHPLRFSIDDGATQLVALIPYSGSDERSREIVVSSKSGGAWQPPVVIANNGAFSDALFQVLPQQTHPLISGDGSTIAYVGYTGTTFAAYVVDRLPGGGWSAPALAPAALPNTHYRISLSRDGNTLALCDYPFLGIQQVYVATRTAGVWSAPVRVGDGGNPSLSADGRQLVYVSNAQVAYSQRTESGWSSPQQITTNDPATTVAEYPQISADGRSAYYWLVNLAPDGTDALVRTAQDLYILRRAGSGWGSPQKVTATPVLPSSVTDGPAAADRWATRLVYTRPVTETRPGGEAVVTSSHLEVSEGITGSWQTERLVAANGAGNYNKWPRLTPAGGMLIFDGGIRYGGIRYGGSQPVYDALWQTTTTVAPPLPPWAYTVSAAFDAAGGSLFSDFDHIGYLFGPGTFTGPVDLTHSFWPNPPPPPPPPPPGLATGLAPIGGIGGIGGLGGAFNTTLLGPGGLPVQPLLPVTITVSYSSTPTCPTIPGSLGLWRLNGSIWEPVPSEDNAAAQVLTATLTHFSSFAIFGETRPLYLPSVVRAE